MLQASEILNASILIVDDQEANVMLLEQVLRSAGYSRITSTMDPRAVCALHAEQRFDLILLDLQMPEMDGFEVMQGLSGIELDGYLPVLVITAQPGHKLRALQAGAKDFVSKPFDLVEVKTRIHNMLEVRLLYRKLANYNKELEQTVQERTTALRQSEARFQRFTELSSDWYWEQDAHGALTKFYGPVREMLGIGAESDDGTHGTWNAAERASLDENIASRRPFLDFVYSRTLANGAMQYLQVSGEPMFDDGSRFIGYRGIGMDISERMRPNLEQRRFRSAMDALGNAVCLVERISLRLIDANPAACALAGYSLEQWRELAPGERGLGDREQMTALFDAVATKGATAYNQHTALRHHDGASVAVDIAWRAVPADPAIMVGVITERAG